MMSLYLADQRLVINDGIMISLHVVIKRLLKGGPVLSGLPIPGSVLFL